MDMFVLGGVQNRPSSVVQGGTNRIEALLAGGSKGFKFVSTGTATFTIDWNKAPEGGNTDIAKIQIGAKGAHPNASTFTLDPSQSSVWGMPPAPTSVSQLPLMQIGYDKTTHRWTLAIVTKIDPNATGGIFSQGYIQVLTSAPITGLQSTGLWPTDLPGRPTLLMNHNGTFVDETVAAHLDAPVQCGSVTAGDFDNDMYVDLYLACRTGASNIANILYHNNGDGTFTAVPNAGGAAGPIGLAISDGVGTADSVVTADYDEDGFLDLFVTNGFNLQPRYIGGPNKLFHNNGNSNHWIELDLVGVNSDRDATGDARLCHGAGRDAIPRPGRALPPLVTGLEAHSLRPGHCHVRVTYGQMAERAGTDFPERSRRQAVHDYGRYGAKVAVGWRVNRSHDVKAQLADFRTPGRAPQPHLRTILCPPIPVSAHSWHQSCHQQSLSPTMNRTAEPPSISPE